MIRRKVHPRWGKTEEAALTHTLPFPPQQPTDPLDRDRALQALARSKRQSRGRRAWIERIHAQTASIDELDSVLLQRIAHVFSRLASTPPEDSTGPDGADPSATRDAFLSLLLHLDRRAPDLLTTAWGCDRFGPRAGNTMIDGLAALAALHQNWRQDPTIWRPRGRNQRRQFSDLTRHLLARYDVPAPFDSVWFAGNDPLARQQQQWFAHIGGGGNLRTAQLPVSLTKRMAHEVLKAPAHLTATEALRWGQTLGYDGSSELAQAIIDSRIGSAFEEEAFWCTVIQFLSRQRKLNLGLVGPIIDYLHFRKFEPQELPGPDGGVDLGPALEPHLSMKSRSLPKLLTKVDRWRATFTPEMLAAAATMAAERQKAASAHRSMAYYYAEEADPTTNRTLKWTIQELSSARSLANEGEAMGHCLSSSAVKLSEKSIWSVQVVDGDRVKRILTVAIDIESRAVSEARGRFNSNPDREATGPAINVGGGTRFRGQLDSRYKYLLGRSHIILRQWLDREGVGYDKLDRLRG